MPARLLVLPMLCLVIACDGASPALDDPIPGIPRQQQRTIERSELGFRWPLSVGRGTLGCDRGAVAFRAVGVTYAVNDAGRARGFAAVDRIWQFRAEGPPTNPLGRITQEERQRIFAQASACETDAAGAALCRQRIADAHRLTDQELKQVDAEGQERRWPPLAPRRMPLEPLIEAGLKLCAR